MEDGHDPNEGRDPRRAAARRTALILGAVVLGLFLFSILRVVLAR